MYVYLIQTVCNAILDTMLTNVKPGKLEMAKIFCDEIHTFWGSGHFTKNTISIDSRLCILPLEYQM